MYITYWQLKPLSWDQYYIDTLEKDLNSFFDLSVEEWIYQENANIYIEDSTQSWEVTNQIIFYLIEQGIEHLTISQDIKEKLIDNIYTNCLDSWFINSDVDHYTKDKQEQEYLQSFFDLI